MRNRVFTRVAVLCIALAVTVTAGCSKKDKGTNPPPATRELDSPLLGQGQTYAHTFATAGGYPYFCTRHPTMTGGVTVQAGAPMAVTVDIQGFAFAPSSAVVGVGGTVTWENLDTSGHTVTSVTASPNP